MSSIGKITGTVCRLTHNDGIKRLSLKYATAGLDPNIFVQKYMIELPTEEEIKKFISTANY